MCSLILCVLDNRWILKIAGFDILVFAKKSVLWPIKAIKIFHLTSLLFISWDLLVFVFCNYFTTKSYSSFTCYEHMFWKENEIKTSGKDIVEKTNTVPNYVKKVRYWRISIHRRLLPDQSTIKIFLDKKYVCNHQGLVNCFVNLSYDVSMAFAFFLQNQTMLRRMTSIFCGLPEKMCHQKCSRIIIYFYWACVKFYSKNIFLI